ncbi:MAG: hypothetical protein HY823_06010 [Acidobacteria bacterium]|nr:hypothetical protein [Acidobacteriota bacterium]
MGPLWMFWCVPGMFVAAPSPEIVELGRGTWVLKGIPSEETMLKVRHLRITCVIDLRKEEDAGFDGPRESQALANMDCGYARVVVGRVPARSDFEDFRLIRNSLPPGARVLVHCTNGNRAAAMACAWAVLDARVPREKALGLARQAGLVHPETEAALLAYLKEAKG